MERPDMIYDARNRGVGMERWPFAEMERMRRELRAARRIQKKLLLPEVPDIEGFEIAGISIPAKEVDGDFYARIYQGENVGVAIADATGKSIGAAMVATMANGMLCMATGSHEIPRPPSELLGTLNAILHPRLVRGMFTAMSLCIINPREMSLLYSNAGMPYPIIKRCNEAWELKLSGMPLGIMSEAEYQDLCFDLEAGDLVIFCSDGVIEAISKTGEMYQTERLLEIIKQAAPCLSAQEMVDLILTDVIAFVGSEEPSDDITIVVIRCKMEK